MEVPWIKDSNFKKELEESGSIKKFAAGSIIQDMNAYVKYIPLVLSGSIKAIRIEEDGKELLLYYITAGESCIASILSGMKQDASHLKIVIEEDAEIAMISVQKSKEWIKKFPEWTDFIFNLYQKRFDELLYIIDSVAFQKIDQRILHLLKQKSNLYKSNDLSITHQQLAEELGITREATSRVLKQLENEGFLTLSRNKISVL